MDPNATLEAIYTWVSNINNRIMVVAEDAHTALALLKGENGHGIIAQVDKLVERGEGYEKWTHEYLENRARTCPIATEITALRAEMQTQYKALVEAATARRDAHTKLLIAGIGAAATIIGGTGVIVLQELLGG